MYIHSCPLSSIFASWVKYLGVIITLNIPLVKKDPPISAINKFLSSGDGPRQRYYAASQRWASLQDAGLSRAERRLCGVFNGDEPDFQAAGREWGAVLGLRLPGAQQADEAPQYQVTDPQHT